MRAVLEVAGVCAVTFGAGMGLFTALFHLGEGEPIGLVGAALVALLAADAVWMWRVGPRRVAPLVLGVSLCAVALWEIDMPRAAVVLLVLAGAIMVSRLLIPRPLATA